MAKVTSTKTLIDLVKRSDLVSSAQLARFLAEHAEVSEGLLPSDPAVLGEKMVDARLITQWQLDLLLSGKYRGFKLGKYTLKDHLGTGGMSSVYLSEHPIMRRPVAIKVLPKKRVAKSSYLERFELEARAVAALDHPNIVRAYDIDNQDQTHYIVMEYVEGRDLQRMVDQDGPMQYEKAADYIAQAAMGLQHAHDLGVVHRDIKPANCLVDTAGTLKILDMGLAKFSHDEESLSAVHKDSVVGTADYLAPEQAVNSSKVDSRADIYGLGGTLYFLLTGHPPFPEGTLTERLLKHQKEEPATIYKARPDAPAALVDICRRMMAKDPSKRTQTAQSVAEDLRRWLESRGYASGAIPAASLRAGESAGGGSNEKRGGIWERFASTAVDSPAPKPPAGDTVASRRGDTRRIQDEDLTLAPLEEDANGTEDLLRSVPDSPSSAPSPGPLDEEVLVQIEEEIGGKSTSGSLVDLLEENAVSTSSVYLPRRHKKSTPPLWMWLISVAAVTLVILLMAMIMMM